MPRSGFWTLRTGGRAVPLDRSQSIRCRAALTPRMYFRGARELGRPDRRGELLDGESERVERIRQLGWFEVGRNRAQSACDEAELFPKLRVTRHVWEGLCRPRILPRCTRRVRPIASLARTVTAEPETEGTISWSCVEHLVVLYRGFRPM